MNRLCNSLILRRSEVGEEGVRASDLGPPENHANSVRAGLILRRSEVACSNSLLSGASESKESRTI